MAVMVVVIMTRMLEAQHDVDLLPPGRLVPDITKLTHLTVDETDNHIETDKNRKLMKIEHGKNSYKFGNPILPNGHKASLSVWSV